MYGKLLALAAILFFATVAQAQNPGVNTSSVVALKDGPCHLANVSFKPANLAGAAIGSEITPLPGVVNNGYRSTEDITGGQMVILNLQPLANLKPNLGPTIVFEGCHPMVSDPDTGELTPMPLENIVDPKKLTYQVMPEGHFGYYRSFTSFMVTMGHTYGFHITYGSAGSKKGGYLFLRPVAVANNTLQYEWKAFTMQGTVITAVNLAVVGQP